MATPWLVVSVRPVESTRTRSRGPAVGFCPMFGAPLPTLSDPLSSVTVLAPTIGSAGLTEAPSGGASAASGSYSAALFGLNGNADATSCVPAAFSAMRSPAPDASGSAGPLTVVRLFRTALLLLAVFVGRDDLGMYGHCCGEDRESAWCCVATPGLLTTTPRIESIRVRVGRALCRVLVW